MSRLEWIVLLIFRTRKKSYSYWNLMKKTIDKKMFVSYFFRGNFFYRNEISRLLQNNTVSAKRDMNHILKLSKTKCSFFGNHGIPLSPCLRTDSSDWQKPGNASLSSVTSPSASQYWFKDDVLAVKWKCDWYAYNVYKINKLQIRFTKHI